MASFHTNSYFAEVIIYAWATYVQRCIKACSWWRPAVCRWSSSSVSRSQVYVRIKNPQLCQQRDQFRSQSPQLAFLSAIGHLERLWDNGMEVRQDFWRKTISRYTKQPIPRVSPGDQPLTEKPEDSGIEIAERCAWISRRVLEWTRSLMGFPTGHSRRHHPALPCVTLTWLSGQNCVPERLSIRRILSLQMTTSCRQSKAPNLICDRHCTPPTLPHPYVLPLMLTNPHSFFFQSDMP